MLPDHIDLFWIKPRLALNHILTGRRTFCLYSFMSILNLDILFFAYSLLYNKVQV